MLVVVLVGELALVVVLEVPNREGQHFALVVLEEVLMVLGRTQVQEEMPALLDVVVPEVVERLGVMPPPSQSQASRRL